MATSVSASTSARCSKPSARPSTCCASAVTALGRAVDDDDLACPGGAQGHGDALAHDTGADDCDAAAVEAGEPFDRHLDRRLTDRRGAAADASLGPGPLADDQRLAEEQVHRGARPALALGDLPRLTHLSEDLGLADDRRVEPGGDLEEMAHGGVVVVRVEVRMQIVGGDVADLAQEVADVGVGAVELLGDGVDLDAVAGADQHDLTHGVATGQPLDSLRQLVDGNRQAFENAQRPAAVVDSDDENRHGTSSLRAHPAPTVARHRVKLATLATAAARRCSW